METIEVNKADFIKINKVFFGRMFWREEKNKYFIKWYLSTIEEIKEFIKKNE